MNPSLVHIDEPSEHGEIQFTVDTEPVSLQASPQRRATITATIRSEISAAKYFLSGNVQVEIEWRIHPRERYESDHSPDIDNIIKPMLDAMSGISGILIDDCQVQFVGCHWVDWNRDDSQLNFRIKYFPDNWIKKAGLIFVEIERSLYFPLNDSLSPEGLLKMLEILELQIAARNAIFEKTGDYYSSQSVMAIQRYFHKSRIKGMPFKSLAAYKVELNERMKEK